MNNLFQELRRRNVFRVVAIYAVFGWLVVQSASVLVVVFHMPEWIDQATFSTVLVGLPLAAIMAFAFEMTPDGLRPVGSVDEIVDPSDGDATSTEYLTAGAMALLLSFIAMDAVVPDQTIAPDPLFYEGSAASIQTAIVPLPLPDQELIAEAEAPANDYADDLPTGSLTILAQDDWARLGGHRCSTDFRQCGAALPQISVVIQ